jgi:hypothetical protein
MPSAGAAAAHFYSGATPACAPDDAAASVVPTSGAAADLYGIGPCMHDLPDLMAENEQTRLDLIGEIFVGARRLDQIPGIFDPTAITGRDELLYVTLKLMDEPGTPDLPEIPAGLWAEFDEPPLFLRQAG